MSNLNKLILGTVQFGLDYGISNANGKPSKTEVFDILETAKFAGIDTLDTASAYGNAIELIGEYHKLSNFKFKIISKFKTNNINDIKSDLSNDLEKFGIEAFECIMLHHAKDLENNLLKPILQNLKEDKITQKIGISIYNNSDIETDNLKIIDVVQSPYNLLDNINLRNDYFKLLKQNSIEIHTRSAFLQGLFFLNKQENLPIRLLPLEKYLTKIKNILTENSLSVESLALNYCFANSNISKVVFGVNSVNELNRNIENINTPISKSVIDEINHIFVVETNLLNPSNWQ